MRPCLQSMGNHHLMRTGFRGRAKTSASPPVSTSLRTCGLALSTSPMQPRLTRQLFSGLGSTMTNLQRCTRAKVDSCAEPVRAYLSSRNVTVRRTSTSRQRSVRSIQCRSLCNTECKSQKEMRASTVPMEPISSLRCRSRSLKKQALTRPWHS